MPDSHSPESDSPSTPAHDPSQPWPGIGRVEIPIPPELFEVDDVVLMHDDLEVLVSDAQAVCLTLGSLVALLRNAGDAAGLGMAELLEGVRMRADLVLDGVQSVQRTVLAWGE